MTGVTNGAVFGMGAVFARNSGMNVTQVSYFMGAFILGGAVAQWPLGKLSDRVDRQWVIVVVALIAMLLALGIGAILGPLSAGLLMEWLGPSGFLWDLAVMHLLMAAFGLYCTRVHPIRDAGETSGHYVMVASVTTPLGTAWAEEAAHEPEPGKLELGLEEEAPQTSEMTQTS